MSGKSLTPDQIAEAVALRAAGFTVPAIADKIGASLRTVHRVLAVHGAKKGMVRDELVKAAKEHLIQAVTSVDRIREEAGRLVVDDIAHARLIRQTIADAAEQMKATNLPEAVLVMRAAAAYSTALKNTSDMLRHSMRSEKALDRVTADELPILIVEVIKPEQALAMRNASSLDDDLGVIEGEEGGVGAGAD